MSTGESPGASTEVPEVGTIDMALEVVTVPVSDVDRAKRFYQSLGWRLDVDFVIGDVRAVQFTPPLLGLLGRLRERSHLSRAWLR